MIVGFAGAAGSGKDTAAAALIAGMGFRKASFAQHLKDTLDFLFGWESDWESLEWKETPNPAAYNLTPREIAQSFGTDWGRNRINDNLWVDRAVLNLSIRSEPHHVFTDVRFPNEAAAIRSAGGIIIYVRCEDRMAAATELSNHESEGWQEWLYHYADCDVSARFGEIERLQEAAVNIVDNYINEDLPRYEPGPQVLSLLNDIEHKLND